jgi:hypothetical protein
MLLWPRLLCRSSQRSRATSVVRADGRSKANAHRLDEASSRQRQGQANLQPPDVGSGTGVCQHRDAEGVESV